jgi:hypothetical protein
MDDMDLTIDLSRWYALAETLQSIAPIVNEELMDAMDASLSLLETYAVDETPEGATGLAKQSINTQIHGMPPNIHGYVVMGVPYGMPLERGRRPGKWPPRDAIALWVRRKLQVAEDEVESVAFLIQRAIGLRGTKGAAMFYNAYERGESQVKRIFAEVPDRILRRVV